MRAVISIVVVLILSGTGCSLAVGPSTPRPNVMVAPEKAPVALVLSPAVQDDYVIPSTGSIRDVPVKSWRTTLTSGFQSAFPATGGSGRRLELLEASLSFAPAAVSMNGTAAVVAQIRFKARLFDATGTEVGSLAGTAQAREANTSATEGGMTTNAAKAVEAMYEGLAVELFSKT